MDKEELKAMKQNATPCMACFCADFSLAGFCDGACCAGSYNLFCCTGSLGCDCGLCCACSCTDGCYTQEQGCCETSAKLGCLYAEIQYPPGMDIGCGCCGAACCRHPMTNRQSSRPWQSEPCNR